MQWGNLLQLVSERSAGVSVLFPEPVSRPQLWSSGLVAKATGEVLCEVVEGRVDTITWKKDGQALLRGRGFHISGSLSILHLRAVKKSDCGSYSCNASNGISWQETSLNVTVAGLSPPLKDVLRIAVVAVVFAAVSGWGLVFPVCQSEKLQISASAARGSRTPSPRTQRGRAGSDAARGAGNQLIPLPAARTSHLLLIWQVF
nr:hemicentin-2-like isoform X1 [Anas platyrhynchos]